MSRVGAGIDLIISGTEQLYDLSRCSLLTISSTGFLVVWLSHLWLADVALSLLLPFTALWPDRAYDWASVIAESVWLGLQKLFIDVNGAKVIVDGDPLPAGESAIVVSNHVEWTDVYSIQELAIRSGMLSRCRWFAKSQLRWVPGLGWGLWAMGMPLVSREWTHDKAEMDRVFYGAIRKHWPIWLIAYSEATRYTLEKHVEGAAWAKAHGKIMPKHLLFPRTKGFIACVQQLRQAPHIKAVYDITIAYAHGKDFQRPPSFWQTLLSPNMGRDWTFYVHVERHELSTLPQTNEELARWLEHRWVEKGQRLEALRKKLEQGQSWEPSSSHLKAKLK
ncbi:hypothetical protein B0A48_08935 [Cryoendolithus antarcticus]|uniref:Phospholipid/glycerol acyltransferase domain-containing protein n=1 Tax=Cryoendolithus antarcticus TaxID=1507870 RepID=A0A1V8T4J6_9PEZI|nr:hypothetical protein B0A48_08935 [Cryoendolithus antarcticus]